MSAEHKGFKKVRCNKVIVPGDFGERMKQPHVKALASSFERHPLIEPIAVTQDYRLIAGGDRLAAHLIAKIPWIWATLWDCNDREALELTLIENAHRRHDPHEQAELRQQLIDLYSSDVPPELPEPQRKRELAKRVAEAMNVKPQSVERAERAKRKKERDAAEPKLYDPPPAPEKEPFRTLGIQLTANWTAEATKLNELMSKAAQLMKQAQATMMQAAKVKVAREADVLRLHETVHKVAVEVRGAIPTSVCPYCKVLDGALDACGACKGTGLITSSQWVGVPKELLEIGDKAVIYYQGRKFSVDKWNTEHAPTAEPVADEPAEGWDVLGD